MAATREYIKAKVQLYLHELNVAKKKLKQQPYYNVGQVYELNTHIANAEQVIRFCDNGDPVEVVTKTVHQQLPEVQL